MFCIVHIKTAGGLEQKTSAMEEDNLTAEEMQMVGFFL